MRQFYVVLGLCLSAGLAAGQTFGSITGEVTDPSGAVVATAAITVTPEKATAADRIGQAQPRAAIARIRSGREAEATTRIVPARGAAYDAFGLRRRFRVVVVHDANVRVEAASSPLAG